MINATICCVAMLYAHCLSLFCQVAYCIICIYPNSIITYLRIVLLQTTTNNREWQASLTSRQTRVQHWSHHHVIGRVETEVHRQRVPRSVLYDSSHCWSTGYSWYWILDTTGYWIHCSHKPNISNIRPSCSSSNCNNIRPINDHINNEVLCLVCWTRVFGTSFDGLMSFWFPAISQINIGCCCCQ